jgi:phosphonate transport system substrate-binding protein
MKKSIHLVCIVASMFLAFTVDSLAAPELKEIHFGSVAMDIPAIMHKRLTPLTNYLSEVIQRPVVLTLSPNMDSAINEISQGTVELSYLTPVAYIRSRDAGNTKLIAKTVTNKKASFQLMIVVRDDSPITRVQQLAGKKFAFGDPAALLQRAVVVGAGMPLENFSEYHFLGHYDNIVRGVLNRDFAAGILKDTMAYKWKGQGVRIIYRSAFLPPYNIAASKKVDDALLEKLKQAFLQLDVNNPEHYKIIKGLDKKYNGFASTNDREYDVVRELIEPFK